ncbi:hypothetical protein P7C71_g1230, partial [Lecanoromycetidae sp. Uapishka_2]
MTDPLSVTASIIAVLQAAQAVTQYLRSLKGGSSDRIRLLDEIRSTAAVLETLKDYSESEDTKEEWEASFRSLNVKNGPLEQLQGMFQLLRAKLDVGDGKLRHVVHAMQWPFDKKDVLEYMSAIDRQKTLLTLARQNDHIALTRQVKLGVDDMQETLRLILLNSSVSSEGETPLTQAALRGQLEMVDLLLRSGAADVNAANWHGRTALMCAASKCHGAIVKRLLATGSVNFNALDHDRRSALLHMTLFGPTDDVGIVDALLATGKIDVDHKDSDENTAMVHAAFKGKSASVQRLLATGEANIDSVDIFGRSVLLIMALHGEPGCERMADQLLSTGKVNVNLKDKEGETAITHASFKGRLPFVKRLLEVQGIEIDIMDFEGCTALMFASIQGHLEVVQALLEVGASVKARNNRGQSAYDLAVERHHTSVVRELKHFDPQG